MAVIEREIEGVAIPQRGRRLFHHDRAAQSVREPGNGLSSAGAQEFLSPFLPRSGFRIRRLVTTRGIRKAQT